MSTIEKSPPVTAFRVPSGKVRVVLEHLRGSPHQDISPERARILAAELIVCADENAHRTAQTIGDGIDVFTQGVDLIQKVRGLAKKVSAK